MNLPGSNGLAEPFLQRMKRAIQDESEYECIFCSFSIAGLKDPMKNIKMRGKVVELLLGEKIIVHVVTDFDLYEPFIFKAAIISPTVPASSIICKNINTSFILPDNSKKTLHNQWQPN